MLIEKLFIFGLWTVGAMCSCMNAAQLTKSQKEQAQEKKIESLEDEQTYKLVLPDGQSLQFAKPLIEYSLLLKAALQSDTEYPVTQYIPSLIRKNSDDMSLQDLHDILTALVKHPENQAASLEKFIGKISWKRALNLFQVAMYFDIKSLQQIVSPLLADEFAKNNAAFKKVFIDLPAAWQQEIGPYLVIKNKTLQNFLNQTLQPPRASTQEHNPVTNVAWSPDGTKIASCESSYIYVWNGLTGECIYKTQGEAGFIHALAWSPDSTLLAAADRAGVHILHSSSREIVNTLEGKDSIDYLAWSSNTQIIVSDTWNNFRVWNIVSNKLTPTLPVPSDISIFALSPDKTKIATDSHNRDFCLGISDITTGKSLGCLTSSRRALRHISSLSWSSDNMLAASSDVDKVIRIWNLTTGSLIRTLSNPGSFLTTSISYSPNGQFIAANNRHGSIQIWDITTSAPLLTLPSHAKHINNLAWSPDGTKIVYGTGDYDAKFNPDENTIKIWNVDPYLLRLSPQQIELLEKIIKAKKIVLSPSESAIYATLSTTWKNLLYQRGYGIPTFSSDIESRCVIS